MINRLLVVLLGILVFENKLQAQADKKITAEEYVGIYKDLAVSEMKRTGIPASITLAQGLLESGTGNSPLAKQANNHFGIKCKTGWTGKTINVDDDDLQECFRAYDKAEDSYKDHSDFLSASPRYAFLFKIEPTDYKGWAYGLRQAGYATNPKYPEMVINNIEKYSLYKYDIENKKTGFNDQPQKSKGIHNDLFSKPINEVSTFKYNNIPAYEIRPGDNYSSIADNHGMMRWEIRKYNDLLPNEDLKAGTIIYLKPKKRKAKEPYHDVKEGEGMYFISQKEGIKERLLYKWNRMQKGQEPITGEKLFMRKKRDAPVQLKPEGTIMPRNGIMLDEADKPKSIIKQDSVIRVQNVQPVQPHNTQLTAINNETGKPYSLDGKDSIGNYHFATEDETVYGLSKTYSVSFADLIDWNHISGPLRDGQKIYITKPTNYQPKLKITRDAIKPINPKFDTTDAYVVKKGETLYSISRKNHVPVDSIIKWNDIQNNSLTNGQLLVLHSKVKNAPSADTQNDITQYHIVISGETLYSIAKKYNVTIADIVEHNNLQGNSISIGQKLLVKW